MIKAGSLDKAYAPILERMPMFPNTEGKYPTVKVDASRLLPDDRRYYQ